MAVIGHKQEGDNMRLYRTFGNGEHLTSEFIEYSQIYPDDSVIKATGKSVWTKKDDGTIKRYDRESTWVGWYDTEEQARERLIEIYLEHVRRLEQRIGFVRNRLWMLTNLETERKAVTRD